VDTTTGNTPFPSGPASTGNGTMDRQTADAHAAVDKAAGKAEDLARRAQPAIQSAAGTAHQAVDRTVEKIRPASEWIGHTVDTLRNDPQQLVDEAGQCISANPWKSVGIALVTGILIGRVIL
jgi:ElaB/YqjD/DUF883 family membrane-anchored ribosome-binding protein